MRCELKENSCRHYNCCFLLFSFSLENIGKHLTYLEDKKANLSLAAVQQMPDTAFKKYLSISLKVFIFNEISKEVSIAHRIKKKKPLHFETASRI